MAAVLLASHYFCTNWSATKIIKVRRSLALQLHPDRNPGDAQALATNRMQYVNAEADQVKRYARESTEYDHLQSVFETTGKHHDELPKENTAEAAARQARDRADRERRERERREEEIRAEAERFKREQEEMYGKPGEAPKPGTPKWKVQQERMF